MYNEGSGHGEIQGFGMYGSIGEMLEIWKVLKSESPI